MGDLITKWAEPLDRDVYLRPDTTDSRIYNEAFVSGYHLPVVPDFHPETVLDLGSNIGLTVAHYAALWPEAHILGVEMDADNAAMARRNTTREIYTGAVADYEGMCRYESSYQEWGYCIIESGNVEVECHPMTFYLDMLAPRVDFVKMDIEGAEFAVIADTSWHPRVRCLLVEFHGTSELEQAARTTLAGSGFTIHAHPLRGGAIWAEQD